MMASSSSSSKSTPNRSTIWIGNLDPKVTEFQLLKLVEPFGKVVRFDFMYATNDRGERMPRGYAFVTFEDYITATDAIAKLNGVRLLSRDLRVQPSSTSVVPSKSSSSANQHGHVPLSISVNLSEKDKTRKDIPKVSKIRALEAKLMALSQGEDFKLQVPIASSTSTKAKVRKKPYDK